MSSRIRVGIIGAGGNTKGRHIPGLAAIDGVELVAVCNRSLASSRRVCEEFNIPRACETPRQIIEDPDIDAVVIGTWPYRHCEYTVASLEAGKHVMCEARMAMNADEGERMVAASRARPDLAAQIVPAPFSLSIDEAVCRIVEQELGEVLCAELEMIAPPPAQLPVKRTWRLNRAYSGNNIMGVGIWYETMMRWVGPAKWVHARLATNHPQGVDPDTGKSVVIDVPDHVTAVGELSRGGAFRLLACSTANRKPGTTLRIDASGGSLAADGRTAQWVSATGEARTIEPNSAQGWRVEAEFVAAIRGEAPIRLTDFDTALTYMKFTDALHMSHRLRTAVGC